MNSTFKREQRYLVIKVKDAKHYLGEDQLEQLAGIADTIEVRRKAVGLPGLECVVIESHWPEYEATWKAIEARVTGAQAQPAPSVPTALLVAVADLVAQMEIVARVGFVDAPDDKDSCAAFCVAEGTWLELMSCVESLAASLAAAPEAKS